MAPTAIGVVVSRDGSVQVVLCLQDHTSPQVWHGTTRVEVLRDRDVHPHRLGEPVGLEQLAMVDEELTHRVEVWEEAAQQPQHLRILALAIAHLGVLLVAVLDEELFNLVGAQREPRELQPERPVFVALWECLVEAVRGLPPTALGGRESSEAVAR